MPLSQHQYYVYYDGGKVFARMESQEPVLVQEFPTAQEAYDYVQSVINPEGFAPSKYGELGFNSDEFQAIISPNCEAVVKAAYGV